MTRFIIRILFNSLAIYLSDWFFTSVSFIPNTNIWKPLLISGIVLSLINAIVKPVIKLVSLPLIVVTFGLFSFVINILMVWLLTIFVPQLSISGLIGFGAIAIAVSLANAIVNFLTKKPKKEE